VVFANKKFVRDLYVDIWREPSSAKFTNIARKLIWRDFSHVEMQFYGINPGADRRCRERAQTLWPNIMDSEP
jgi:hypothetical protein